MSLLMVLKIFSDCCICFAIVASGPITFETPLLLIALLCGLSAGLATVFYKKKWKVARWFCGLLPLLCLQFGENSGQLLLLAMPVLYTSAVIFRGKLELEYYSYSRFFRQSLMLLGGAYAITNIWLFLSSATGEASLALDGEVILRYGIVHLLCGIVLQRQLRLGVDYSSKSNRRQIPALLGTAAIIAIGFAVAEPFLREQFVQLVGYALMLLGLPIMLIAELLSWILEFFANKEQGIQIQIGQPQQSTGVGSGVPPVPDATVPEAVTEVVAKTIDPVYIWAAVITVLLVVAAVILYRSFQKQRFSGNVRDLKASVVVPPKKKRDSVLSNRHRVRQLYRDFLRTENGHGLKLKCSDTSADVLRRIHADTDKESAAKLRQIYLSARYDDRESVSRSQVTAAKQALKGTKSGKS